jgi:hypothetical protein
VVVVGLPGAGKVTFVKQLLEPRAWRRTGHAEGGGSDPLKAAVEELRRFVEEARRAAPTSSTTYICAEDKLRFQSTDGGHADCTMAFGGASRNAAVGRAAA